MKVRDRTLLRTGLAGDVRTASVADGRYTAEFGVETPSELHRTRIAAGEEEILVPFLDSLDPGMEMWDVGAAVGTWTCLAGRVVDRVRAFEPHRENGDRLLENAELNGIENRVTLERVGLGDHDGSASLTVGGGVGTGTHRIEGDGDDSRRVTVRRGDSYPSGPDALKVDVEGFERHVLDGMGTHLDDVRVAAVEVHPQHDVSVAEVRDPLEAAGLAVREVEVDRRERYLLGRRPADGGDRP